jgi:hypothetical protein
MGFRYGRLNPWSADQKLPLNKVSYLSILSYHSYLFSPHIPFSLFSPPTYLKCDAFMTNSGHSYFKTQTGFRKVNCSITNYSQVDATFLEIFFIFTDALYVSGGSSAHHQEHIRGNCTYSFKYCQPILLLAATVEEMELT